MNTNNQEYGVGKNKADGIAKIGRKNQMLEREIEKQVAQEMLDPKPRRSREFTDVVSEAEKASVMILVYE